jgi:hypothetical protein
MATYEYWLEHKPAGGRMESIKERINKMATEGWEPFLMSGSDDLTIMLRRPRRETPAVPAQAPPAPASEQA